MTRWANELSIYLTCMLCFKSYDKFESVMARISITTHKSFLTCLLNICLKP